MATFKQIFDDLNLMSMAQLIPDDLKAIINRAAREEVEAWPWSTLLKVGVVWGLPAVTTGTVAATLDSPIVTASGANFPVDFPDYAPEENWVIKINNSLVALAIESFDSATQLTLTQPWKLASAPLAAYELYAQFTSVPNALEVYAVRRWLDLAPVSRAVLNIRDPYRLQNAGNPAISFATGGWDLSGNVRIEPWPRFSTAQAYAVEYRERWIKMIADADLCQIPASVVTNKATYYAFLGNFSSSGDARFAALAEKFYNLYIEELEKARYEDERRQTTRNSGPVAVGYDIESVTDLGGPPFGRQH